MLRHLVVKLVSFLVLFLIPSYPFKIYSSVPNFIKLILEDFNYAFIDTWKLVYLKRNSYTLNK